MSGGKYKRVDTENRTVSKPDMNNVDINSLIVSDSVILWTDDDKMKSFIKICTVVVNLIANGMGMGFPMRGAITIGELTILNYSYGSVKYNSINSIIGKGLVDAYTLEKKQNWVGCIIDDKCILKYHEYKDAPTLDYLIKLGILCKYPVPCKKNRNEEHYVINWASPHKKPPTEKVVIESFSMHGKSASNSEVQHKLQNTLDFLRYVLQNPQKRNTNFS